MEGWQHCLMSIQSKNFKKYSFRIKKCHFLTERLTFLRISLNYNLDGLKCLNMDEIGFEERLNQPDHAGNPFMG